MTSATPEPAPSLASAAAPAEVTGKGPDRPRRRHATVYDAVAGRVSADGFIPSIPRVATTRDTASSSAKAVGPEEVLFRRRGAPARLDEEEEEEEADVYSARDVPAGALPESDLVKALHSYASDFYARATEQAGATDWRSMDETALLALGILMEEVCRENLGERGDLVFTEGVAAEDDDDDMDAARGETDVIEASAAAVRSGRTRKGKKRRRLDEVREDADQA